MEIVLPAKPDETKMIDEHDNTPVINWRALNILITGENHLFYYIGRPPMTGDDIEEMRTKLHMTDYGKDGIRKIVLNMNMDLYEKVDSVKQDLITGKSDISQDSLRQLIKYLKKKDKRGPIVMIKADKNAKYKNVVDIIDEMAICNVARYTIIDMNEYEEKLLKMATQDL
jgi:hypothetical protein